MSIINTSLLDANNYEKHQKILLEFLHDMYLMTDTQQTAHLSIVSNKLHKSWEATDQTKSKNLWNKVNELVHQHTGKNLSGHDDLISLIKWAFRVRKLMENAMENVEDEYDDIGMWTEDSWEDYQDDY
jgi:hypothetical protein